MLRRACAFRGGNALLVFCIARCLSTKLVPARAATAQNSAQKTLPPPVVESSLVLRRRVRSLRFVAGDKQQKQHLRKAVASGKKTQTTVRNKHEALKRGASRRSQKQPAASRRVSAVTASLRSKVTDLQTWKDVRKGRPHAHAVQKKKYNKRVAAIAKLWRMQKKKTPKGTTAVPSKK
ncbi:hypothetical protein TraAM80_06420 [Trypanosoma rangeli]|uniref:Kinetoplast DNA-associated protein n=1 Tax=Trypanosoma rangeli TaxID=5698 RepID=A0A3R7LSC0_TRYRA|nr:uncharacterized protein TraAM80_06420 [Trypanosoma rangeli]RNF02388.1 hypothetical protein TraAM80_06420 [Trypanosoma rangeli]|eukprot:RNF02388.1 hypothetical protein TraAM80_06420 [Trypanosoma rangeli]